MYRLVVDLPFGIMLVHKKVFFCAEAAQVYKDQTYSKYPGLRVWTQTEVDLCRSRAISFPFKVLTNER